jgi:hypothetical protein
VVPLCEQLRAQHKRAVETSGVRRSVRAAFLQQSMPAISGMLHPCSLEWRGMPAKTLPPITRTSASDAKRVTMPYPIYGRHPTLSRNALPNRHVERITSRCRSAIPLQSQMPVIGVFKSKPRDVCEFIRQAQEAVLGQHSAKEDLNPRSLPCHLAHSNVFIP